MLYFAAQGSGNVLCPVLASTLRLLLVAAGGVRLAQSGAGAGALSAPVGISMTVYGLATAAITSWRGARNAEAAVARTRNRPCFPPARSGYIT